MLINGGRFEIEGVFKEMSWRRVGDFDRAKEWKLGGIGN